jgi:hypothetical protein
MCAMNDMHENTSSINKSRSGRATPQQATATAAAAAAADVVVAEDKWRLEGKLASASRLGAVIRHRRNLYG